MSNRETKLKPLSLTSIAGVNERTYLTELSSQEYTFQEGLFPEFAGLQSRLWGKRVLQKYVESIYGIYQFWTPLGYGVGLYQFDGSLDFGYWLTPTSAFDLTPPLLGIDLAGYTLDEFGLPYGSNFGISTDNTCVLSFLEGGTDHSSCAPAPTNVSTPDDSNGGPAGQGKKCSNEVVETDYDLADFTSLQESAGYSNTAVQVENRDNCRNPADGQNPPCVNFPPLPLPLLPIPEPTPYASVPITGVLAASKSTSSSAVFNLPTNGICTFRTTVNQVNNASNNKLTINTGFFLTQDVNSVTLVLSKTPGGEVEITLEVSADDQILNANDYLELGPVTSNVNQGFDQSGSVTCNVIRTRQQKRVCV